MGIVSFVNAGPHSNASYHAIPYFDGKYVAFGRVIDGYSLLMKMNQVKTTVEKPNDEIVIEDVTPFEL